MLAYLAAHRRPGEPVYAYFTAWQAIAYYGPRLGLQSSGVSIGRCDIGRVATYRAELNRFAGASRLWVFFTHEPVEEGSQIVAHLDTIGARRFTLVIPQWPPQRRPSASLYGYDLSVAPAGLDTVVPREHNPRCPSVGAIFPVAGLLSWNSSTR